MKRGQKRKVSLTFQGMCRITFIERSKTGEPNVTVVEWLFITEKDLKDGISIVKHSYDSIVWLKLDKDYFGFDNDVYLRGAYIWCQDSPM